MLNSQKEVDRLLGKEKADTSVQVIRNALSAGCCLHVPNEDAENTWYAYISIKGVRGDMGKGSLKLNFERC
jgi:hypothetical protein